MIVIDSYVFSVFPWEHDSSHKVRINAKYAKAKHILLIFWGYDWSALDLGYCSARKYDVDLSRASVIWVLWSLEIVGDGTSHLVAFNRTKFFGD